MTSEMWLRRSYSDRESSPSRRRHSVDARKYRVDVDNDHRHAAACAARKPTLSPNTSRKKIAELENCISQLKSSNESVTRTLGWAERALRDIDLSDSDELSDDEDQLHLCRRHHAHRLYTDTDREELRRRIARLREDLGTLRRSDSVPRLLDTHYDDYERGYYDYRDTELTDYRTRSQLVYQSPADSRSRRTCLDGGRYRSPSPNRYDVTGARSAVSRPLTTQYKCRLHSPTAGQRKLYHTFDVSQKRAYKPRVPGDLNIGDVVKFRRSGGRIEVGEVHYVGHLPGHSDALVGVELQHATGNHDGVYNGFRYFECKPNRGLFVPFDNVILAWGSF